MIAVDLLKWLLDRVRAFALWRRLEPYLAVVCLGGAAAWGWREYIEATYQLPLAIDVFARSYAVKVIAIVVFVVLIAMVLLQLTARWRVLARLAVIGVVVSAGLPLLLYVRPRAVENITVKFMDPPAVNADAVAYLLYELNKRQRTWYFDVDFDVFNSEVLKSAQRERCEEDAHPLCWANAIADGRPFIGVASQSLGEDSFSINRGNVSVISTDRWDQTRPPTTYEFIVYSVIVQSIIIHLNTSCSGLPRDAFTPGSNSRGGVFEFAPRRGAYRAIVLAGHMSRTDEARLLNCFGDEYLANALKLLSLDWMRAGPVRDNLAKSYAVIL